MKSGSLGRPDMGFCSTLHTSDLNINERHQTFVSPAMGATLHTFLARSVLMMELLPTLG